MKLGTQIRFESDGREATVVFNSLIGAGAKWGLHDPEPADFEGTNGGLFETEPVHKDFPWEPDVLLREPWGSNKEHGFADEDCRGDDFEVIRNGYGF